MTIVIAMKVGDGIVLGADSASTMFDGDGNYHNSYFNADKLSNLVKGLPLGTLTFGLGTLRGRSIGSLVKDLRLRMADVNNAEYYLDPSTYTVREAAEKVRKFFYVEHYRTEYGLQGPENVAGRAQDDAGKFPWLGFFVAGYSAGGASGELFRIDVQDNGGCDPPAELISAQQGGGAHWEGQTEACLRLARGFSSDLHGKLVAAGLTPADAANLLDSVAPLVNWSMPIQDAIDFVQFLVDVTCKFVRFSPGPATVAEPIDCAAITPHEGFRWVHRKHYFPAALNPGAGR